MIIILGLHKSGLKFLSSFLSCSKKCTIVQEDNFFENYIIKKNSLDHSKNIKNIYGCSISYEVVLKYGIDLLDKIKQFQKSNKNIKFIWQCRDAVSNICSISLSNKHKLEDIAEYWYITNCLLWYFYAENKTKVFISRLEDCFLLKNHIKNIFNFCEIPFHDNFMNPQDFENKNNIITKIDAERIESYNPIDFSGLEKIWDKYKRSNIVKFLQYNRDIDIHLRDNNVNL